MGVTSVYVTHTAHRPCSSSFSSRTTSYILRWLPWLSCLFCRLLFLVSSPLSIYVCGLA